MGGGAQLPLHGCRLSNVSLVHDMHVDVQLLECAGQRGMVAVAFVCDLSHEVLEVQPNPGVAREQPFTQARQALWQHHGASDGVVDDDKDNLLRMW